MKKLLVYFTLLLTFSTFPPAWGQNAPKQEATKQEQMPKPATSLSVKGDQVQVRNAVPGSVLEIYDILGVRVATITIRKTDETLSLDLPKGYYILKLENVVRKIVIK